MQTAGVAVLAALLALATSPARAAAPGGTDPNSDAARWYHSLLRPDTGTGCCDVSDCRPVNARQRLDHWEVFIDRRSYVGGPDDWVAVPDAKVLHGRENPEGLPVACWLRSMGVLCFVPPAGT